MSKHLSKEIKYHYIMKHINSGKHFRIGTVSRGKLKWTWVKEIKREFYRSRMTFGYRRVLTAIERVGRLEGKDIPSLGTVKKYMNALDLASKIRRKKKQDQKQQIHFTSIKT